MFPGIPCGRCRITGNSKRVKVVYLPRGGYARDFRVYWHDDQPMVKPEGAPTASATPTGHRPTRDEKIDEHLRQEALTWLLNSWERGHRGGQR